MHSLESIQQLFAPLFPGLIGVRFVHLAQERIVAGFVVRPDLCTVGGILHGGAYMALADTLGAIGTLLNIGEDRRTTTTDSSTKFIGAARVNTTVVAELQARCIAGGQRWCGKPRSSPRRESCARSLPRPSSCWTPEPSAPKQQRGRVRMDIRVG